MSPFKGDNGAPSWYKDVMFAMMRTQLGNLDLAQDRYLNSQTTPTYLKFAKEAGFTPDSVTLPSGIQAHWIGDKNAQKVLLYCHGMSCMHGRLCKNWADLSKAAATSSLQPTATSRSCSKFKRL